MANDYVCGSNFVWHAFCPTVNRNMHFSNISYHLALLFKHFRPTLATFRHFGSLWAAFNKFQLIAFSTLCHLVWQYQTLYNLWTHFTILQKFLLLWVLLSTLGHFVLLKKMCYIGDRCSGNWPTTICATALLSDNFLSDSK